MNILQYVKAPRVIEYLSLDVERYEYEVLKNFDFGFYTFLMMSIERPNEKLHKLLISAGYTYFICFASFGDVGYIHKTLSNYNEVLKKYESRKSCQWVMENKYMQDIK